MAIEREQIRNFAIVAHIDHGKSTLADRMLLSTGAINEREFREQILDDMDLERERGITIKASAVTVHHKAADGKTYMLNLIDTPGHVDFHYEVSRALAACEGALLVVDATQGVEAQTVANAYLAVKAGLEIIPVVNKVDLPAAQPEVVAEEIEHVLGIAAEDCLYVSAKSGLGVPEMMEAIVRQLPPPTGLADVPPRALIFDSVYDDYRGVVVYLRMFEGRLRKGQTIRMMSRAVEYVISDLGKFRPKQEQVKELVAGEVGYMIGSIKELAEVTVGDTVTDANAPASQPLPGYKAPQQMVFCDFFPASGHETTELREAMERLRLNDASFTFQPIHSDAMGFGFRCGFLGLLHMEIIQERLERESNLEVVQTAPTVSYEIGMRDGTTIRIDSPGDLPDGSLYEEIREPIALVNLIVPADAIGNVMKLAEERHGVYRKTEYLSVQRVILTYTFPLAEIIYDFYDRLKSLTRGYGTMDYEVTSYEAGDLAKVDILVAGTKVDALSIICHRSDAERRGRRLLLRLRKEIDRHLFEVVLQAAIGGKIIARESIAPLRKNVTAKCYGGDITRKRKLLEKQKEGKKRMKTVGSVDIPQEAFKAVLEAGDE
ncbi:MAG: Elongation factor 4 [Phycisphaerae bacterium]|nr:Elongation factor 4 [Phycisphaerae bacterium]